MHSPRLLDGGVSDSATILKPKGQEHLFNLSGGGTDLVENVGGKVERGSGEAVHLYMVQEDGCVCVWGGLLKSHRCLMSTLSTLDRKSVV